MKLAQALHASRRPAAARAQRGQILLLLLVLIMSVGVTLFVSGASSETTRAVQAEANVRDVLGLAKQAVIGRAVGDANRPGSLPCPAVDESGVAASTVGQPGGACPTYIGRLPWRTLGIGELRDEAGELLWYAVSPNFRDYTGVTVNSDTKGTLTVYSGSTALTQTSEAAAIIFAPGLALGNQIRDETDASCPTTVMPIWRKRCVVNYLETGPGSPAVWNNASATGPYLTAPRSQTFNDRLAVIRTADFMPLVEQRVAREIRDVLIGYQAATREGVAIDCAQGCYPWADSTNDGVSDTGQNRGRLPTLTALPYGWTRNISAITQAALGVITTTVPHGFTNGQQVWLQGIGGMTQLNDRFVIVIPMADAPTQSCPTSCRFSIGVSTLTYSAYTSGGTAGSVITHPTTSVKYRLPVLPAYIQQNNWRSVLYYTVGQNALQNFGLIPTLCVTCTAPPPPLGSLTLNSTNGHAVILITPGSAGASRPSTNWSDYIDDAQNRDANDTYITPVSKAMDRDRVFPISDYAPPGSCGPNAQALMQNAPCHTTGNNVKAVCQQAATNLSDPACACNLPDANGIRPADRMIQPPCRNTLNPGQCQSAVAQLQTC